MFILMSRKGRIFPWMQASQYLQAHHDLYICVVRKMCESNKAQKLLEGNKADILLCHTWPRLM